MPFQQILTQYFQFIRYEKGLSENSVTSYKNDLNRYLKFLTQSLKIKDLGGATIRHIELYIQELSALGLSASTIARNISSIRSFHDFAVAEDYCKANPADLVDLPRQTKNLPEVLTPEEVAQILEIPDRTTDTGIRSAAILETLYATGMRVSELTALEQDQLFFEIGFIRVIGKGRKERLVPIGEMAQTALEHYIEAVRPKFKSDENPQKAKNKLFLSQRGNPLSRMSIWNIVNDAAKRAGIKKMCTRISFGTLLPHIYWKAAPICVPSRKSGAFIHRHNRDLYSRRSFPAPSGAQGISSQRVDG